MDEFFGLLPVLIIYLVAASSGKRRKKQNRRRQGPKRTAAQGEQTNMRSLSRDIQTAKGFEAAFESREKDVSLQTEKVETDCDMRKIHLHEPSQMALSGEGEDPCHAGGADASNAETEASAYDIQDEQNDHLALDMLRGVIMSEILTRRPCSRYGRTEMQRGRR